MLTQLTHVTPEERKAIGRARTHTLCDWWDQLNGHGCPKRLRDLREFDPQDNNRAIGLMDTISCELGMRYMREHRRTTAY